MPPSATRKSLAFCRGSAVITWDYENASGSASSFSNDDAERLRPHGEGDGRAIGDMTWNHNGQVLASCTFTPQDDVKITHIPSGKAFDSISTRNATKTPTKPTPSTTTTTFNTTSLSFGCRSRYLSVSSSSGLVSIWDLKRKKLVRTFHLTSNISPSKNIASNITGPCARACFDPSDNYVAALSSSPSDGSIRLFQIRKGTLKAKFGGSHGGGTAMRFNLLDPSVVSTGTADGSVLIWDLERPENPLAAFETAHKKSVTDLSFSPTNRVLSASGSMDGSIAFRDVRIEKMVQEIRPERGEGVTGLGFHADGQTFACGTAGGWVGLYDLRKVSGGPVGGTVGEEGGAVKCVSFPSPSSNRASTNAKANSKGDEKTNANSTPRTPHATVPSNPKPIQSPESRSRRTKMENIFQKTPPRKLEESRLDCDENWSDEEGVTKAANTEEIPKTALPLKIPASDKEERKHVSEPTRPAVRFALNPNKEKNDGIDFIPKPHTSKSNDSDRKTNVTAKLSLNGTKDIGSDRSDSMKNAQTSAEIDVTIVSPPDSRSVRFQKESKGGDGTALSYPKTPIPTKVVSILDDKSGHAHQIAALSSTEDKDASLSYQKTPIPTKVINILDDKFDHEHQNAALSSMEDNHASSNRPDDSKKDQISSNSVVSFASPPRSKIVGFHNQSKGGEGTSSSYRKTPIPTKSINASHDESSHDSADDPCISQDTVSPVPFGTTLDWLDEKDSEAPTPPPARPVNPTTPEELSWQPLSPKGLHGINMLARGQGGKTSADNTMDDYMEVGDNDTPIREDDDCIDPRKILSGSKKRDTVTTEKSILQDMLEHAGRDLRRDVENSLLDFEEKMENSLTNIHVDMLRQFQEQSDETVSLFRQQSKIIKEMMEENMSLRRDNEFLRRGGEYSCE